MAHSIFLGIQIDQVALLRQQRPLRYPDPVMAALIAEQAGADTITLHLQEDQHPVQDRDLILLKGMAQIPIHLKMAPTENMLVLAEHIKPEVVCLVLDTPAPEIDMDLGSACEQLQSQCIAVCVSVLPDLKQIESVKEWGVSMIEIDASAYAQAPNSVQQSFELSKIEKAVRFSHAIGLQVNIGHGLHYHNVSAVAKIPEIHTVTVGHAIIAKALFNGLESAVREMKTLLHQARL